MSAEITTSTPAAEAAPEAGVSADASASAADSPSVLGDAAAVEASENSVAALSEKLGLDLSAANSELESKRAEERVAWALEKFRPRLVLTSSFGAQSAVSLHLVSAQWPEVPVILIDTGYLFPETYDFIDQLSERLSLNLKVYRSAMSPAWQEKRYGKLWEQGLNGIEKYNQINKVEPMNRALAELEPDAWVTGLRRDQSTSRENLPVLAAATSGTLKVHPIVDWTDKHVFDYLKTHDLPYHPLWEKGYVSIGDWHTSRQLTDGLSPEETRFFGLKRECGLHEDADFVI